MGCEDCNENINLLEATIPSDLYLFLCDEIENLKFEFNNNFPVLNFISKYESLIVPGMKFNTLKKVFSIVSSNSDVLSDEFFGLALKELRSSFFDKTKSFLEIEKIKLKNKSNWHGFSFGAQALNSGITGGTSDHYAFVNIGTSSQERVNRDFFRKNDVFKGKVVVLRVHSECFYGDVFGSRLCDCGVQLKATKDLIEDNGSGLILYLRQEGRGAGLKAKNEALRKSQTKSISPDEAMISVCGQRDLRNFNFILPILREFGLDAADKILLITDNTEKLTTLTDAGFCNVEQVSAAGDCLSLKSAIEILEKVLYSGYSEAMIERSGALKWIKLEVKKSKFRSSYFENFLIKLSLDAPNVWPSNIEAALAPIFVLNK